MGASCYICEHHCCMNGESGIEVMYNCDFCDGNVFLCSNDLTDEQLKDRFNGEACGCGDNPKGPLMCRDCEPIKGKNALVGYAKENKQYAIHSYFDVSFNLQANALCMAIKEGQLDSMKIILERGYPGLLNHRANEPLQKVIEYNRLDIAKYLIEQKEVDFTNVRPRFWNHHKKTNETFKYITEITEKNKKEN